MKREIMSPLQHCKYRDESGLNKKGDQHEQEMAGYVKVLVTPDSPRSVPRAHVVEGEN